MDYDFLSFVDSKAIRRHIRSIGYEFTPAEQAVIITRNRDKTPEEKIVALEYLFKTYADDEFGEEMAGAPWQCTENSFRQKLRTYIDCMKKSLSLRDVSQGYVFIKTINDEDDDLGCPNKYFPTYRDAFEEIKKNKKFYEPDQFCEFIISAVPLVPNGCILGYDHIYDKNLRLISADPVIEDNKLRDELNISGYFVWIPLPFKKGDLVKVTYRDGQKVQTEYGVFTEPDDERLKLFNDNLEQYRHKGSRYSMLYPIESFSEEDAELTGGYLNSGDYQSLDLDYPEIGELDNVTYGTKYLAMALDDDSDYSMKDLLYDYSWGNIKNRDCYVDADKYLRLKITELNELYRTVLNMHEDVSD
ncbi:hypothetical protein [Ruminococcus albus]|uniref:Uncharacterized protein n=1 Tax=Ruminococcus albus TaxID=1264 RepID=A0A1I1D061_RUMAL|nr:hypothetical protein [Ruminococcus albus]SFB66538.1 hypothetical protein SAMN02910406_00091 [Ruminococcus albus]